MRSDGVVVDAPALGQHAQLGHRVEDFSVQELIPQFRVDSRSSRSPRESRVRYTVFLRPLPLQPATCADPWQRTPARCRAKVLGHALDHHHIGQCSDYTCAAPTPFTSRSSGIPECAHRSGSASSPCAHHAFWRSRSRSSIHGARAPA